MDGTLQALRETFLTLANFESRQQSRGSEFAWNPLLCLSVSAL
jgi:hypothetical protein